MDTVLVPALALLAGLAARGVALVELLARLRWRERRQSEHRAYLTALARELPTGSRLDARADDSTLHLVITPADRPTERHPMTRPALPGATAAPAPQCPRRPRTARR